MHPLFSITGFAISMGIALLALIWGILSVAVWSVIGVAWLLLRKRVSKTAEDDLLKVRLGRRLR
jgi:hypothetical protein